MDASEHLWFGNKKTSLHIAIDDATSQIVGAYFDTAETLNGYYQITKDASTFFSFDKLRKGTHVLEYDVFIMAEGKYLQGIVSVQSVYAPEFGGHSASQRMIVK